ncbi:MAG: branched-chain amino acid ABC transporter permease [Chloroflexi bacterium]|nr:branched-chain amino acid ABC transporter permease [Chloroflexota bacterium]
MTVNWAQVFFNSAITGSLYLIGAVGLTLIYGLSRFPNFAHAEFITLGAYIGYLVAEQAGLGLPLALVVAFLVTGIVGLVCYRGIFQPLAKGTDVLYRMVNIVYLKTYKMVGFLRRRGIFQRLPQRLPQCLIIKGGATIIHLMVTSIALGFILRYSIGATWTWKPLYFTATGSAFDIGPLRVTGLWLMLIFAALALSLAMHCLLMYTKIGKAIRATSSNPELASASGINVDRVIWITWFIGAGLAAIAGIFLGADTAVVPLTGWNIILPIFAVAILGGIGNFYGAIAAAFIIGLAENLGVVGLVALGLSTSYRLGIAFLILIVTLIVKPEGLAMLFRRA